jgi:hypothetical protein
MDLFTNKPTWFNIRPSRSPKNHPAFSGVVLVSLFDGNRQISNIQFDERFLDRLGKYAPLGITDAHPSFLNVVQSVTNHARYRVVLRYVGLDKIIVCLWEQVGMPDFVGKLKRV